jgi:Flp pilus assembly pilin Flp
MTKPKIPHKTKAAALVEYIVLVGLIAVTVIGVVLQLGIGVQGTFDDASTTIDGRMNPTTPPTGDTGGGDTTDTVDLPTTGFPSIILPPGVSPGDIVTCTLLSAATGTEDCIVVDEGASSTVLESTDALVYYDFGGVSGPPGGSTVRVEGPSKVAITATSCSVFERGPDPDNDYPMDIRLNYPTTMYLPCFTQNMLIANGSGYDGWFPGWNVHTNGAGGITTYVQDFAERDVDLVMYSNPTAIEGGWRVNSAGTTMIFGDGVFEIEQNFWVPFMDGGNGGAWSWNLFTDRAAALN